MAPLKTLAPQHLAAAPVLDLKLSPEVRQLLLEQQREPALAAQAEVLRRRVDRIVVLMLENRSFDHLLGWLGPQNGGLSGAESNPKAEDLEETWVPSEVVYERVRVFRVFDTSLPISPPHANKATVDQIRGGAMDGFLRRFAQSRGEEIALYPPFEGHSSEHIPMACYGPAAVPAYRHLVQHHTVCSRYHSSVPAGTWPNRMYLYAGSSNGLFNNGKAVPRDDAYDALMPKRLLVDLLDGAGVDWCAYAHGFAWLQLFPGRRTGWGKHTRDYLRHFRRDCKDGTLPPVVFVDPNWSDVGYEARANDDLAPADLMNGQRLVAEVYNALLELPAAQRERTMFVVTYDEHGGFFDHVPPPPVIGYVAAETDPDFATYGVRVPALVVSSYAPSGVSGTLFDHASLHATIHRRFLPGVRLLSGRAQVADTFGALLTLAAPRPWGPPIDVAGRIEPWSEDPFGRFQELIERR